MYYRSNGVSRPRGTLPVILIHRAGSSSHAWWPQMEAIGERRQLVAVDLPGHGESGGEAEESIRSMGDAVCSVIEELSLRQAVVVGHSMGGAVALSLALYHPDRVGALLLIGSGAKLRVATPIIDAVRHEFDMLPQVMTTMVFSESTPKEVVEMHRPHLLDAPADVVLKDLEACDRFDVESRLGELTLPVRCITGKEDYLTPPRIARRLVERAPDAELHVVPGTGHMLPLERPEIVNEAILAMSNREVDDG